jgi:hypothetical protein
MELMEELSGAIIKSFHSSDELKLVLKQSDLFGKDLLWYIAEHNIYSILGSRVMDRIMQDFWRSNIDVTGNILECSTSFKIMKNSSFSFTKDEEKA